MQREQARIALRDQRKAKALEIENKRRQSLGEEILVSLDDAEEEDSSESEVDSTKVLWFC